MYSKGNNKNKSSMARKANNPTTFKKIMLLLLVITVGFLPRTGDCQIQGWEITFGAEKTDEGRTVIQSIDEGYIVIGVSNSFGEDNDQDVYVVRTDVDGTQIWSNFYDEAYIEDATSAVELADGSIVIAGHIEETLIENPDVYLLKISKEGQPIWSKKFETPLEQKALDIQVTPDGGFIVAGTISEMENSDVKIDAFLMKLDSEGNQEWMKTYGSPMISDDAKSVVVLNDGYAFTGGTENPDVAGNKDAYVRKVDLDGNETWIRTISNELNDEPQADFSEDIVLADDGNLIIVGSIYNAAQAMVSKINIQDGSTIWLTTFGDDFVDKLSDAVIVPGGDLAVAGSTEPSASKSNILIARLTQDGTIKWWKGWGSNAFLNFGASIALTEQDGFVVTGFNGIELPVFNDLTLIKVNGEGDINSSTIGGRVFADSDDFETPCEFDLGELFLENWLVKATRASDSLTFFTATDEFGNYEMFVDTGFYTIEVLPINDLWIPICNGGSYEIDIPEFYEIIDTLDFPIEEGASCPFMTVDISSPIPEACEDLTLTVDFCNLGTAIGTDIVLELILDDELTYVGNNGPDQNPVVSDSMYTFQLGDLDVNECSAFEIYTSVSCDNVVNGQSLVTIANIYPDSFCVAPDPEWDGSSLKVAGYCDEANDEVKFTIENIGDDMQDNIQYIVIQDDVILFLETDGDPLEADAILNVGGFDNDGSTYRIVAPQTEGHPGNSFPTVAVEGCVVNDEDEYETGFVSMFPENDGDDFVSIDVQEILVGSSEAALLRGYPKGYGLDNRITANTDITYIIQFENTGTDTINRVVIRDTLSENLDITTTTPGTSSHPYDFKVYDDGILKVTFSDIALLPGGSAEEAQSKGFIKFRVAQKPNLPEETEIRNRAAVFFDYHEPVLTETVWHNVACDDNLVTTASEIVESQEVEDNCIDVDPSIITTVYPGPDNQTGFTINLQPNPFNESIVIELEGRELNELVFSVYDMMGRLIRQELHQSNIFTYYRNGMPAGLYLYRLESEGQLLSAGKIIAR
jgi:uncharacterized repeat protein (TIGR01451 family)